MSLPRALHWTDGKLEVLDQRQLPNRVAYLELSDAEQVVAAISSLAVRGAPAIGITAAYGLVVAMAPMSDAPSKRYLDRLEEVAGRIAAARPTAINLSWAVKRVCTAAHRAAEHGDQHPHQALTAAAEAIHAEDREQCRAIAAAGRPLITPDAGIMTHCNAGALAVSELGTATAPMYAAHGDGVRFRAYACETRPLLQGARLTAWELHQSGIDVTVLCDDMAASLMARGAIDLIIVGTDRVTRNGDVINKIGTLTHAIVARHFGVPFWVACPASTFDADTARGTDVPIEQRSPEEVTTFAGVRTAPEGVPALNPAFDVTPADLVTGFITDRGLLRPPFETTLQAAFH